MAETIDDIKGVGPKTVTKLEEGGIKTLDDIANSDVEDLTSVGMSNGKAKRIIHEAQKSTVQIQSGLEVEEDNKTKRTISTDLSSLDEYTEGGLSDGEIVAAYGSDGSGKTQLAFKLAVEAVEKDSGPVIWVETERSRFQPQRIKAIANDENVLDDIYRIEAHDLETQYNSYEKIMDSFDDVSIVIIDSLTARFRLSDKFDERSKLSARSSELGKHINAVEDMVDKLQCPCLVTAQVYGAPTQYSSGDMMWGGSLLKHSVIYKFHMKNSSGETHEINIEQHPSTGDNSLHINISEDGVEEV